MPINYGDYMSVDIERIPSQSMDIENADLEKFRAVFPQCFSEGKLDISKLLALFGQYDDNDFEGLFGTKNFVKTYFTLFHK